MNYTDFEIHSNTWLEHQFEEVVKNVRASDFLQRIVEIEERKRHGANALDFLCMAAEMRPTTLIQVIPGARPIRGRRR